MSAPRFARSVTDVDESDGNAGFLRAARDGNLDEVLEYLKGSTDINTSNPNGLNALHLASKEGHINIVTELLNRGANVEAATKKGNTALHIASLAGHEDIVRKLVENGAQVNLQAQAGFTPLYMASQEGHAEVVKYLLSSGANQGLSTEDGFTPLAVALQQGHDKVVSVLLEHDAKGKVRLPALHIAAKKDDVKSAALLLQNEQNSVEMQTKSGFTPLHIASHYGNTNVANLLIQRNADVNFKAKNNITPLHVGSRWGKLNMVNVLLDNNAIIDEKTRDGLTPLHCAARSGHESVVDALLERGAPHSAKTKNGLTPLHMAAQGDHEDCARLLLYHKASLNEVTVDYLTPLHVAAHCGNVKTAKLLLDRKCEPNARALNGFTPLHIACKKNRIKVVELLLKYGASIETKTESGLTPLHVASFMGHMNIVIYLIQHNANPNTATVRGETSLHLAARANQSDIIRILLRNGATVDARAREQQTPLHIAARLGNVDNVVLLLQHGAVVDATTKDKYTPLHIAAKEGHDEVAQVLLENEAQHDITTKKGFTPLHIAAKYGNIKVARLLLQKDANPDAQGKNGLTPLHVATHYNHANVAQLLLENKANPHATAKNGYTPLHIAAKKNQMDIATMLLEYGAKPNAESKNGFTPLHLAAQEGHTDIVSLLLEKDANVNAKAHNGLTPMHLAAQEDRVPVAEILCKYDAETDTSTKAGYTPLHTACHFGQVNMVRFLLDHEASVNATTKVGYTPLHQAAQQGHVQVVGTLLKHQASPNAVTNNGQTPLAIAQKLGYISVVEILKPVTEVQGITPATEDKYKVVSPETMQETFISDSEDEGGEDSISLERGGSASPLDTSFDKDIQMRYPATDHRGRQISQMGATMHYPSYLENGPDYEEEMRYYHGDTLSPKDKNASGDKSRLDSVFYSGDYSTLGSNRDSLTLDSTRDRSTGGSTGEIFEEDDLKYVSDDNLLKKDYMDAQITSQSFQAVYSAAPPTSGRLPVSSEANRFSSYSGSSFSTSFDPDNVPVDRSPVYSGFLISFMVDARGGAMRGCRHPGVRVIIPPRKCCMPTRVTCRLVKKEKLTKPPPMLEGEGLAARVLEMGPVGTKFLGPVLLEVPHFASLRGKEREVVILRSDNGETWYEHPMQATEDAVAEALGSSAEGGVDGSQASVSSLWKLDSEEDLSKKRIKRILTSDLPMYFALVSRVTRVKQESTVIGMEGGVLSSNVVPQVQAVLPEGTLTRPIPVGLQAQPIAPELVAKLLGNRVAVSPIVTIEPRRRKFHKPITLTIPVPRAAQKGMINQYGGERPTLRLLVSLAADPNPAQWEDMTETKAMTLVDDCVSFTTTVSARFWLIDCQNTGEAAQMASVLYQEAVTVPYMAKFVVFAKRDSPEEGKLRIFCMTDDKDDKTLEKQEKFYEVARSRDIEVLEGRPQFVEMAGNLIPVTKSGDQLHVNFRAFRENRLPCTVKIRDQDQEASARVAFMKEPKVARGEAPQTPICNLNIRLPDMVPSESSGELDTDKAAEIRKRHDFLRGQGLVIQDSVNKAEMKLSDIADTVQGDWVVLAQQLHISISDINHIKNDYKTVGDQALAMLHFWVQKNGDKATGNQLENALRRINRDDVVRKCMYNVERVDDELEAAAARAAMDQSGFDTFKEEVGITKDSMKRGMSLDVQYDEQDMIKESESAAEESPTSDRDHPPGGGIAPAQQQPRQVTSTTWRPDSMGDDNDLIQASLDTRRPVAPIQKSPQEEDEDSARRKQAYLELAMQMDQFADMQESRVRRQDSDDTKDSVKEDEIVRSAKTSPSEAFPSLRAGIGEQQKPQERHEAPEKAHVTFSDQPEERRYEAEDEEEVLTPPPSPTEKIDTEEPVLATESNIAEAATRLASEAGDQYDSEDRNAGVPQYGQASSEREVMYSRAEVASEQITTQQATQHLSSEPSSQIVSPVSDGGSSYHDEPSPVPEPTMPEDFREEELAYEKPEDYDDEEDHGDHLRAGFRDDTRDSIDFRDAKDKSADLSSDTDAYRTADQSLDDSRARLDQSRSSDVDGGRYDAPQEICDEGDIQRQEYEAVQRYPGEGDDDGRPSSGTRYDTTEDAPSYVEVTAQPEQYEEQGRPGDTYTYRQDYPEDDSHTKETDLDRYPQDDDSTQEKRPFQDEDEDKEYPKEDYRDTGVRRSSRGEEDYAEDESYPRDEYYPEDKGRTEDEDRFQTGTGYSEEDQGYTEVTDIPRNFGQTLEDDATVEPTQPGTEYLGTPVDDLGSPVDDFSSSVDAPTGKGRVVGAEDEALLEAPSYDSAYAGGSGPEVGITVTAQKPDREDQRLDLTAVVGDEGFVDRQEERIEAQPNVLPREQTPDRASGFQVSFPTSPIAVLGSAVSGQPGVDEDIDDYDDDDDKVFDTNVAPGETYYEEVKDNGTIVKHRKFRASQGGSSVDMEEVSEEGPPKEETEVDEHEEILPDGTVHHVRRVRSHSLKKIKRSLKSIDGEEEVTEEQQEVPGSTREDVVETFDEPPRMVRETEDVEHVLDDGSKVHRRIVYNRMVHHIRTHQESFDSDHGRHVEDYEIEEVIPGTESAFVEGQDSSESSEDEEYEERSGHHHMDAEEKTEVMDDGTIVTSRLLTAESTKKSRSRTGSIDESEESARIEEETIVPSPRPRSPVDPTAGPYDPYDVSGKHAVSSTTRSAHLEQTLTGDTVESTLNVVEDMLARGELEASEGQQPQAMAYDSSDGRWPPTETTPYVQFPDESEDAQQAVEPHSPGAQADEDVQTHRVMMKKEVHKKTTIGVDGQEETTIREDSQVQQENEPPEELRESMQEIINQFMETDPQPAQLPPSQSHEEEV